MTTVPFPRSRLIALFLGGALGDALGASVEFADTPELERRFTDPARSAMSLLADAHLTDDTQTTLWLAEGLIRAHQKTLVQGVPSVDVGVRDALLRWYVTQEPGCRKKLLHADSGRLIEEGRLWGKRSPDNTNLLGLGRLLHTPEWRPSPVNDKATESAGALMRSAPYAVFNDVEECFEYALRGASLTHSNPAATTPAAFYAALIQGLIRDIPWQDSYDRALGLLASRPDALHTRGLLEAALNASKARPDVAALGGGWTATSVLTMALCVFKAGLVQGFSDPVKDSKRLLRDAVLHSGKSDTTGALVGQLIAAHGGQKFLPKDWLVTLEARGTIEGVASDLYDAWVVGSAHEFEVYPAG